MDAVCVCCCCSGVSEQDSNGVFDLDGCGDCGGIAVCVVDRVCGRVCVCGHAVRSVP